MTSSTDFDRVVASWLEAAGPADLDHRTIDAAFETARRRRQRRGLLAWLVGPSSWPAFGPLRGFTALPASLRIALLVGLVLALLGVALYAGGRLPRPIGEVPSGSWVALKPDNLSFGTPSGPATMTLEVGSTARVRLSLAPVAVFESTVTIVADHQIELVITSVTPLGGRGFESGTPVAIDDVQLGGCKLGEVGRYTWSMSADRTQLTLVSAGDACPSREAVLARTWNAHEIPWESWVAVKPDNMSFGTGSAAHETMTLDLGGTAMVRVSSAPEIGFFGSTQTDAADHAEFVITSRYGLAAGTPISVDGRLLAGCAVGDVGRYIPSLSGDGSHLTLASAGDAYPSREGVLARTWTRSP